MRGANRVHSLGEYADSDVIVAAFLGAECSLVKLGRFDDQYGFTTSVGYGKKSVTRYDLVETLEEILANKGVRVAVT